MHVAIETFGAGRDLWRRLARDDGQRFQRADSLGRMAENGRVGQGLARGVAALKCFWREVKYCVLGILNVESLGNGRS